MNYVLGSSLTGLLVGYILDCPIIGGDLGGRSKAPFPLGPMILEQTEEAYWLMFRLCITVPEPKKFIVGYYENGEVSITAPDGFKDTYYEKTRGSGTPLPSTMSGGKSVIVGWDVKDLNLLSKLKERVKVLPAEVLSVDTSGRTIHLKDLNIFYDRLINTVPLPKFMDLAKIPYNPARFKTWGTYFVKGTLETATHPITKALFENVFSYVYVADPIYPFHRVTRISENELVMEIREDRMHSSFCHPALGVSHDTGHLIPDCQMIHTEQTYQRVADVDLIGRYAEWDHRMKIEHVIRRAKEYARQMG